MGRMKFFKWGKEVLCQWKDQIWYYDKEWRFQCRDNKVRSVYEPVIEITKFEVLVLTGTLGPNPTNEVP